MTILSASSGNGRCNNRGDLRRAVNAIMTLDALFGILHRELHRRGTPDLPEPDDRFKDELADRNEHYRLLRDTAFTLKHGELDRGKPRLFRRSDQVRKSRGAFSAGFSSAFDKGQVWIATDHEACRPASMVIEMVLAFARSELTARGLTA